MENKQTAIEYIVNVVNSCIAPDYIPNEIVNKAKQMEKEQMQLARRESYTDGWLEATKCIMKYTKQQYNDGI